VEILYLQASQLTTLDELFARMARDAVNTTLRVLDLSNNNLTSLKANVFSRLIGLVRLDLRRNDFEIVEEGAFSGLINLQELSFSSCGSKFYEPLDLAVFGNEPDLANLRFLNLYDFGSMRSDLAVSSVDPGKLFAHCRHQVVVQACRYLSPDSSLLDDLARSGRVKFVFIDLDLF
jgi:hypothetical protein